MSLTLQHDPLDQSRRFFCPCTRGSEGYPLFKKGICTCEKDGCYEKTLIGGLPCAYCSCRAKIPEKLPEEERGTIQRILSLKQTLAADPPKLQELYDQLQVYRERRRKVEEITRRLLS